MTQREVTPTVRTGASEAMLREYYERRAPEYERIYQRPERQTDLACLRRAIAHRFAELNVLDVACGTGYWTACFAGHARSVVGVDANPAVLDIARGKALARTRFTLGDALLLSERLGRFDAAFVGFWWSHVPKRDLERFVESLHQLLRPGARVVLLDNLFVPGSSTPIVENDDQGDAWQERVLSDGSRHRVLKNFPQYEDLMALVGPRSSSTHWWRLDYYWWFDYTLP
jgi:demethylmenaquinone methyltransferase/2-methoxy-6-polyprenyl-1,4-benzoquinol methylase